MELGVVLVTVVVFALLLATVSGFLAARVLMHAAEARSPQKTQRDR
jgi:hypothetical protein